MAILSICIPTYNRAEILRKSLDSLVSQKIFRDTDDIDIIISDNCSTDNTRETVCEYIARHGDKVKYFRNETNIKDANFPLALSRGDGCFLKLCNDTLIWLPNSLEMMTAVIRQHMDAKPVLFFMNKSDNVFKCNSLDEFVARASYMTTWIGGMGIWHDDVPYLGYMEKYSATKLPQTAVILRMVHDKHGAVVVSTPFCRLAKSSMSGDYNISEIFIKNYLAFYRPYVKHGNVSRKTYHGEMYRVLTGHVLPRQFNIADRFNYDKSKFWQNTAPYHFHARFYVVLGFAMLRKLKHAVKNHIRGAHRAPKY